MNNKRRSAQKAELGMVGNVDDLQQAACDLVDLTRDLAVACPDQSDVLQKIGAEILPAPLSVMIVGQVKVGKSKFLNGLTGRGGLLPSDVNPLTTVLTNLHFNRAPEPQSGAAFHFYKPQEWENLTKPGEDEPEQLRKFANEIAERAEDRFGDQLPELFGKTHQFDTVTSEILQQYVSSGDEDAEQYDDLIRTADVCFDTEPFPCPIRFTDTPGVNDPCLIRDKITWEAIGDADYYLVILTAHQAMSRMDEALLKVLKDKGSGRAVIFINRIDELRDCARDAKLLQRSVQNDITRIFGGAPAAVLCGSAQWAHFAGTGDNAGIDQDKIAVWVDENPNLKRQFEAGLDRGEPQGLYQDENAEDRYRAYVASGMPQLRRFISKILLNRFADLNTAEHAGQVLEIAEDHLMSVQKAVIDAHTTDEVIRSDDEVLGDIRIGLEEEQALLTLQLNEDIESLRGDLVAGFGADEHSPVSDGTAVPDTEIPLPDDLEHLRLNFISGIQSVKLDLIAGIQHAKDGVCASFLDYQPLQKTEIDASILRRFSPDTKVLWSEATAMARASWASRLFHRKQAAPSAEAIVNELLEAAQTALLGHTEIVFRHYLAAVSGNVPDDATRTADNRARLHTAERLTAALRHLQKMIETNPQKMDQSA